jgi:geranylgeranyl reductase family protein
MSGKRPDLDALVIGAGPAGSECARRLAEAGFSVVVAEEHPRAGEPLHCTGIISAQAYSAFDLPRAAVQCELASAELTSPGGITLHVDLNGSRPHVVDRSEVDRSLATRAQRAGARFSYRTRVCQLSVDRTGVAAAGLRAGEPWQVRARAAVLATGARSPLPRQAGLADTHDVMHGAQAEVPVPSPDTMRVWLGHRLVPGGFGWVVPGRDHHSRLGVLTRVRPKEAVSHIAQKALPVGAWSSRRSAVPRVPIRVHPIPAAPRHPTSAHRVLSVGDAAGQVKMTTGGGVYYGLLGARIAAEVLAEGLSHGRLSARHLSRYETLWQRLLGPEQRAGQLLRRMVSSLPDEALDDIFASARRLGLSRNIVDLLDFDWHARPSLWLIFSVLAATPTSGSRLRWLKQLFS